MSEGDLVVMPLVPKKVPLPLHRLLTSTGLDVSAAVAREALAALVEQGVAGSSGGGHGKALSSSGG